MARTFSLMPSRAGEGHPKRNPDPLFASSAHHEGLILDREEREVYPRWKDSSRLACQIHGFGSIIMGEIRNV
jgi:hypothetical protein